MNLTRQQLIFLGVVGVIIVIFLAIVFTGGRQTTQKINLTVWGLDNEFAWDYSIYRYQKEHPRVRIKYTQLEEDSYEEELINALAAGRGPDIFMISNRWTVKHADKVSPMPAGKMSVADFSGFFPQVAEHDFLTTEEQIYGLPLSIDTLALFYNRDIFDRKSVALPPKTWEEFLAVVPKLRTVDKAGNLTLAAAAIGGNTDNISNAPDILELLMLQTGALRIDEHPSETVRSEAGGKALEFYTQFSNPESDYYTWDEGFSGATEEFAEERAAMMLGYTNDIAEVKAKNPFLNFAVEPAPQVDLNQAVSIANYWGLTVSAAAKNPDVAWDFVVFAATDKDAASYHLTSTSQPPALRSLINDYLDDPQFGVFSRQALTARGFYEGDDEATRNIFDRAIRKATAGNSLSEVLQEVESELRGAENKYQQ